jgi:hypothetical protein
MDRPSEQPGYSEIVESIFAASTLEEAITWREAMLARLGTVTEGRSDLTADEARLHQEAKFQTELALENLRFCLLNNERAAWEPVQREWQNTAVWMKYKP